jgi:hypothetical protein
VRWYDRERPPGEREYELYDLHNDPYQLTNLVATDAGRAAHEKVVADLDRRLAVLNSCASLSCR